MPHYCTVCRVHFQYESKLKHHKQSKRHVILAARKRLVISTPSPVQSVVSTVHVECTTNTDDEESNTGTNAAPGI